jgi:hypothetical protein
MVSPRAIWREGFLGSGIFCVQEAATRKSARSSGAVDGHRERVFMAHLRREPVFMAHLRRERGVFMVDLAADGCKKKRAKRRSAPPAPGSS